MASSKLTALPTATTPAAADLVYISQSATSKKLSFTTLYTVAPTWTAQHVFLTNSSQPLVIRNSAGVAGTNELQIYEDTNDIIFDHRNPGHGYDIRVNGTSLFSVTSDPGIFFPTSSATLLRTNGGGFTLNSIDGRIQFASNWGVVWNSDTFIVHGGGAGIIAVTDYDTTGNPGLALQAKSSTTNRRDRVRITTAAVDNTDASRKYRGIISAYDTADRECVRVEASGSAPMCGFFGVAAVVQPATAGTLTGFTANATANAVFNESTFTGNTGSAAYTISDIVKALKQLGLLAS